MPAGRPKKVDPGSLYAFAHQFYWDFRQLDEGSFRWWHDRKKFEELAAQAEVNIQLSDEQKARAREVAEEEVRTGRLSEDKREERIKDVEESQLFVTRDWLQRRAAEDARKELKIPGEPDIVDALLQARTPEQVREICADAWITVDREVQPGVAKQVVMQNWPISSGSVLPMYLSKYASEFIAARKNRRFPRSVRRPSSRLKRLWFLSRALAGALYEIRTRTAINLVGSKRPEQVFEESGAARPARSKRRGS